MLASTAVEAVTVDEISKNVYESRVNPENMGNARNIAYGGFAMGVAVNAACRSVDPRYRLYSAVGHYLGPALIDRKLRCTISSIRDTRTFATRTVTVSQIQDNGQARSCMFMVTDFQIPEKASLLVYTAPPSRMPCRPKDGIRMSEVRKRLLDKGAISKRQAGLHEKSFNMLERFFDQRYDPNGMMTQVLTGVAKTLPTTQDHLPLTERTSIDWIKTKVAIENNVDSVSTMAFALDGAISFVPLSHNHMFLDDAGACSSLDFALRFFSNEPRHDCWHVREIKTITGGEGRTFSEGKLWDEDGNMIASMSQQSILRPLPRKASL